MAPDPLQPFSLTASTKKFSISKGTPLVFCRLENLGSTCNGCPHRILKRKQKGGPLEIEIFYVEGGFRRLLTPLRPLLSIRPLSKYVKIMNF